MPISDAYAVQFLLEETLRHSSPLIWHETETECYTTELRGIAVELAVVRWRSGPRVFLTFSSDPEQVGVTEPLNHGFFRRKYENSDDERLAGLMRQLAAAAASQCAARTQRTTETLEKVRESVYRRLMGFEDTRTIEPQTYQETIK